MENTEKKQELEELENKLSDFIEEDILPPQDIVAFNELRSCADLFRMYEKKQLEIRPDFQRNFVWGLPEQTRFIDSLIKQLPIPNLCIGLDCKTDRRIVIDGLQRVSTIVKFLSNDKWRLSKLLDIDERISGKTVADFKQIFIQQQQQMTLYDRIENFMISVIVLRYDFTKQSHRDYLFTIFHRLNTGGKKLNNQEIRNCIYSGVFNDLLKELADSDIWKELFGEPQKTDRLHDEEIILRVFAFNDQLANYNGNLAKFLNNYMSEKRHMEDEEITIYRNLLMDSLSFIKNKILNKEIIREYGRTLKEGLLVGIAHNINNLKQKTAEEAQLLFKQFQEEPEFSEENIRQSLALKEKVQSRLEKSILIFNV
jgi:hypothetical protein